MGWSATKKACDTLDAITQFCIKQTGSQNVFLSKGNRYFLEVGRERNDGSITAQIYRFLPDSELVRRSGSLKIESDGELNRGPAVLKKAVSEAIR